MVESPFMDDFSDPGGCVSGVRVDGLKPALSGLMDFIRAEGKEKTVLSGSEPRINDEKKISDEQRPNVEKKA